MTTGSGIRNPNATYGYREDDWPEGSLWTFRREQTGDDRDAVSTMTTKQVIGRVDRKKVREMMKRGEDIQDYITSLTDTEVLMSTEKAMLARMSVRVEGKFFTIPDDFTDDDGRPHPMAGQLIPQPPPRSLERKDPAQYKAQLAQFAQWLGLIDPEARSEALQFMSAVWAGADPDALKRFPGGRVGVDESTGGGSEEAEGGLRLPARTAVLPGDSSDGVD